MRANATNSPAFRGSVSLHIGGRDDFGEPQTTEHIMQLKDAIKLRDEFNVAIAEAIRMQPDGR
jgi:hypothetical protein